MFASYEPRETPRVGPRPPPDARVERARPSDLEAVAELSAERAGTSASEAEGLLARWVAAPERRALFVARDRQAEVVGFGKVAWWSPCAGAGEPECPDGFYLGGLVVDPRARRRGIGHWLTRARVGWAAERGSEVFYVATVVNGATIDLHAELGFVEIARGIQVPEIQFTGGVGALFRRAAREESGVG